MPSDTRLRPRRAGVRSGVCGVVRTAAWLKGWIGLLICSPMLMAAAPALLARPPPSILFDGLYQKVEMQGLFADQKTFADAVANEAPAAIMAQYTHQSARPGFDLSAFVAGHFTLPAHKMVDYKPKPDQDVRAYISSMWSVLERRPDEDARYSSLLPLRHPYIVPGGRFSEIYYWDSYFTMLGLEQDGRHDLAIDMMRNMASLIDRYGHIPNGNRSYYLSRSEPPFFACMIDLMAARDGAHIYLDYLPQLQREHDYWMEGAASLPNGAAHRHVVRLADGTLLNRYWDDRDTPRDESYREDVETARGGTRPAAEIYRELRAGSETGWDFSSRWLADGHSLSSIRTTQLLPVDLNSLMAHMEQTLAHAYALKGDTTRAKAYAAMAQARIAAIHRLMWDARDGVFTDYVWTEAKPADTVTAATVVPLFFHIATADEARQVAGAIRMRLLRPGGMTTSLNFNGQQWDSPNGWAPMQWMAVEGLRGYGDNALAEDIARRWIACEVEAYAKAGVLLEKYNVRLMHPPANGGGGGGEYPLQLGFGWTNGVLISLMRLYPDKTQD